MRIQTTVPILAIIFGCIATGKFVSDVSYIRSAIESQGALLQVQASKLLEFNDRLAQVEAHLGLRRIYGNSVDGAQRNK